MFQTYRQKCANQTNPSQLVIPETLLLLPLYLLTALKIETFKIKTKSLVDTKIYLIQKWLSMSFEEMFYRLYPRIYNISDIG